MRIFSLSRVCLIQFLSGAIVIGAGLRVMGATPATLPATAPSVSLQPVLKQEDICDYVNAGRSKIEDLTVSYTFNATHSYSGDPYYRYQAKVVLKGGMLDVDYRYSYDPAVRPRPFGRDVAFNGSVGTIHEKHRGIASTKSERPTDCALMGLGFFDIGMLDAPEERGRGYDDLNLVSLLRYHGLVLHPKLEVINGHPCYAFDVLGDPNNSLQANVWLDPAMGFLPAKAVFLYHDSECEIYIDTAKEVLPGLWLPLHGRKIWAARQNNTSFQNSGAWILEVKDWDTDHPDLAINTGVKDEFFDLWKRLPPGTLLVDDDTGKTSTVPGMDFRKIADNSEVVVQTQPMGFRQPDGASVSDASPSASLTTSNWRLTILLAGIAFAGVSLAAGLYLRKSRHA